MQVIHVKPWLPHKKRAKGVVVDTVVLHATAGSTANGAIVTLRDRGLSYHYIIDKDGSLYKCAPASAEAFHAGESVGPCGSRVNRYSVGVSLVNLNDGRDPYTLEQTLSLRDLLADLVKQFPSLRYLTTHAIISPGRKTDPKGYKIEQLARDFGLEAWKP